MYKYLLIILLLFFITFSSQINAGEHSLDEFQSLVKTETWTEIWLDGDGNPVSFQVEGELWTSAFQAAINKYKFLQIPDRKEPYYLEGPLILKSGCRIKADSGAEIRLKPECNTCMVRNENILNFSEKQVSKNISPDTEIDIEGGIWTTLATGAKQNNGNSRGFSSKINPVPGTHGVILLHNVEKVSVKNITVRQSKPFAIHVGNARNFVIDGLKLDQHRRDGVHVNGPSSEGHIRNVSGDSHDDTVALNAWEWRNYTPSFGPIHHISIKKVSGSVNRPSADSIRLLPGVKQFKDGSSIDCTIDDIEINEITNIREFKFYDQPNLEVGRDKDYSLDLGKMNNIHLHQLTFNRPGVIQIACNLTGLRIEDVNLNFTPKPDYKLVEIGPMSMTWRANPDPSRWVEIFSPDRDVTVRNFHLGNVSIDGKIVSDAKSKFIQVKDQQVNSDYPKTTPKGGTGKAVLIR